MANQTSQSLGSSFEVLTQDFFLWLFNEVQFQVNNHWIQKSGYQFGFDVGFEIAVLKDDFFKRSIYIECKNYESTTLVKSQLYEKLIEFDMSSYDKKDSIFIFLSPKVDIKQLRQDSNPKLLEDYFNSKKSFKTIILTPNNRIKEIFSLSEAFFKQVYANEIFTALEEKNKINILEFFKKLLQSKGELPNFNQISVNNEYLQEASLPIEKNIYIPRYLKTNKFSFLHEDKTLIDSIKENDIVLLLGEPGSGKTTELMSLSNFFKEKILELEITPIFVSLSNVKKFDKIGDILPSNWESHKKIVLLLDALDEFEFKNKIAKEIKVLFENTSFNIKVVISSRTYNYNDELSYINPIKLYLDGFSKNQSFKLLSQQYNISTEVYNKIDQNKFKDILEDPFMLNRLGIFYVSNGILPSNVIEIYEDIRSEIPTNDLEKYKLLALILELTKKTQILKKELRELFGVNYKRLDNLKFIQSSFDGESFKFIHKNYQEYFSAISLSELSFHEILKFIVIDGTLRTHPSLFNTITFLIHILDTKKYDKIVSWLMDNELELLFKADKNRIENFRVEIFQKYFQVECIEKTFWIFNNRTFTVKEIAEFGNSEQNFDYLNSFVIDEKNHFRVIISALELLSFFNIPVNKLEKLKRDLFEILSKDLTLEIIKANIVDFIYDQKICKDDTEYLKKIFELFKSETSKQINRALLSLVEDVEDVDDFYWYIKAEFLREKKITERKIKDEVIRGNSYVLERIIVRLESSDNFMNLVKYYFDETRSSNHDRRFADEIVDRCLYFDNLEDDFLIQLLSSIDNKVRYYFRENLFKKVILESKLNSRIKAFDYLLKNYSFNNIGYFLASITQEDTLAVVVENFVDGTIESKDADLFRNVIVNHGNRELAGKFNNILIENGFIFNQPFLFEDEFELLKIEYEKRPQKNFDLLFEKEQLLSGIREIFKQNDDTINSSNFHDIELKWYDENGHSGKIDISYSLLSEIVHEIEGPVAFIDIEKELEDDFLIIGKIKSELESKNSNEIEVKGNQKEFLYQWFEKASKEVRFDRIIKYVDDNRFNLLEDYFKLKCVLFFSDKLNFVLSKDFLLNTMEFFDIDKISEEDNHFENLSKKINDEKLFDERIISNLINKKMYYLPLSKHIQYALDKKLNQTYYKIKEYFLLGFSYKIDDKIGQYFNLTNDIDLLKKCCQNIKSHICWTALRVMVDLNIENDFCFERAIEYLESEIDDEKNYYYSNALAILFQLNKFEALEYVNTFLDNERLPSLKEDSFTKYDAIKDYGILEYLFEKIYMGDRDRISFSGLSSFLTTYISNLSKTKFGFDKTQDTLNKIKIELTQIISDHGLFYINLLIDTSNNSYINFQSKPLTFNEALVKVEEILN